MQKAKPRRPGPPKSFDADVALKAAMFVFWRKGFDGATLSDLTRAMGINRPSLYGTFGDKESLFSQAVKRYGEQGQAFLGKCEFAVTARQFVEKLLRTQVEFYTEPGQPPGCFFIQGAIASGASEFAQETTRKRRIFNEQAVATRLSRGDWPQQIPIGFTPKELAAYIASIANGMAVRAADGASRYDLYRVVDLALAFWPEHGAGIDKKRKERPPILKTSSKQPSPRKRRRKSQ